MNVCLRCNARRRTRKDVIPCACGYRIIKVSRCMLEIAKFFHTDMGFCVYEAVSNFYADPVSNQLRYLSVHIWFDRHYDVDIFLASPLPENFTFIHEDYAKPGFNSIYYIEDLSCAGLIFPRQEQRNVIRRLHDWASDFEANARPIWALAGKI